MPKGIPPKHSQFKPGQSGNPGGKPKNEITAEKVRKTVAKLSTMNREQLLEVVKDPKSQMFEVMFASVMAKAAKDGDYGRLNFLLERTIGRVTDDKHIKITPVIYETSIKPDGTLIQEALKDLEQIEDIE